MENEENREINEEGSGKIFAGECREREDGGGEREDDRK